VKGLVLGLVLLTSCGWHQGLLVPAGGEEARSVGVAIFDNQSLEPDLEADFAGYLSAAVADYVNLTLESPEHADLVVRGVVLDYRRRNGIRSRDNELLEGSARLEVSAELVRRSDGRVLRTAQTGLWAEYPTGTPALTTPGVGELPARERLFRNLADRLILELFSTGDTQEP